MSEHIATESKNGVFHIIFNRPEKRNALTRAMYAGFAEGIDKAEKDPKIRVILIYGKGKCFCAGNDLRDFQDLEWGIGQKRPTLNWTELILRAKKPIIGAVHGYSIGVGVTMLLHFDLIYAGTGCKLQFPFVNLGLVPEFGSTFNLPELVGYQRAAELFFFGDWFTVEEAERMGMINKIFPENELIHQTTLLAEKLAEKPPEALRKTKELIKKQYLRVLSKLMPEEGTEFSRRQKSPEAQEAFKAFFERRKPDFSKFS
ncbi:MAG: enoyl-CoA hydratase [Promethearchaeota archaeon]|jgi:enoyl-CoA hydratase/carnithine racemase